MNFFSVSLKLTPTIRYTNYFIDKRHVANLALIFGNKLVYSLIAATLLAGNSTKAAIPADRLVNVVQFGAIADDGTDDTLAINQAINFVGDSGGGTVVIPAGTFLVNSQEFHSPLRTRSHLRIRGERDPISGQIVSILKMPRPHTNRSLLMIGDPRYADESVDGVIEASAIQDEVEIADLAFDLDNGHGGRAIQLRYLTSNVYIHDCEGFQSALDRGEPLDLSTRGDNHFFNMGCYGQPGLRKVPENITLERCRVRGTLQLTADGGAGSINLMICDNQVTGAFSHGIALTSLSREVYFENAKIINNQILDIGGNGIYVSQDQNESHHYQFIEGERSILRGLLIFGNTLELGPTSVGNSGGIQLGSFIEMSDVAISNNIIKGSAGGDTSRIALTIAPWDYNWNRDNPGSIIESSAFLVGVNQIRMPAHSLITGMQIEFQPFSASDRLPNGLETFRRYRVKYITRDTFALTAAVGGPELSFGPEAGSGHFFVTFSPAVEQLRISTNSIVGPWDYGAALAGSIEADVIDNLVEDLVSIAGEHEALILAGNEFRQMLVCKIPAWDVGCSLLAARPGASPARTAVCSFSNNRWIINEDSIGPVYAYTAAVTFDPRDLRRTMEYAFEQNTVSFATAGGPKFNHGFRDAGQTGTIKAYYSGNYVARGMDSSPSNRVPPFVQNETLNQPQ